MKKLICILILAALLLAPAAFAKGCAHENTRLRNAVKATCRGNGYSGDLCCADCDAVLIPGFAVGNGAHKLEDEPRGYRKATCTQPGFSGNYYCIDCNGLVIKGSPTPVLQHVPKVGDDACEPSCGSEGYTATIYCALCRNTLEDRREIPAPGHDFSEIYESVDASCRSAGVVSGHCITCDWDVEEEIPQLEHNFENNVCTGCGYYAPGLYDNDGKLVKTWEQLCDDYDIYSRKYRDYGGYRISYESVYLGMTGMLVLPDDADIYAEMFSGIELSSMWFGKSQDSFSSLANCPNLESVYIFCDTEIELSEYDLHDNPNLKEVVIAEGCDFGISTGAFANCPKLEKLVLPADINDSWISSGFVAPENLTVCYRGTEETWNERFGAEIALDVVFNYTEA